MEPAVNLWATGLRKLQTGRTGELTLDECEALVHFGAESLLPPDVATRAGQKWMARRDPNTAPLLHGTPIPLPRRPR